VHFRVGLEPTTYRTSADSLPIEITGWFSWTVSDSNRQPSACKAGALPLELTALAARAGFEPATRRLTIARSAAELPSIVRHLHASCVSGSRTRPDTPFRQESPCRTQFLSPSCYTRPEPPGFYQFRGHDFPERRPFRLVMPVPDLHGSECRIRTCGLWLMRPARTA
jgi:hypothetical protein